MRYSLITIFRDAVADETATLLDGTGYQARLLYGCKISKDDESDKVLIQNTTYQHYIFPSHICILLLVCL